MKMCETCGLKHASFGLKGSGSKKRQWCGTCAKEHGGVYLGKRKMCDDCKLAELHILNAYPRFLGEIYRWVCGV